MKVTGEKNIGIYHVLIREKGKRTKRSSAKRHFCLKCGSALWLWDPRWPELIHPHAGDRDTRVLRALPLRAEPYWRAETVESECAD